jgi:dsRNA-specific ribonuclease
MAAMAMIKHPVSRLQEICQVWKLPLPSYKECGGSYQEFGTEVVVQLGGGEDKVTYKALGKTKKASKTNAAQMVLDYITKNKPQLLERPEVRVVWWYGGGGGE